MAANKKWPPKTKWLPNPKTDHNSLNFQPRSSRFCMVTHIGHLQITHFGKQNGRLIKKLIITPSIFKLEGLVQNTHFGKQNGRQKQNGHLFPQQPCDQTMKTLIRF